MATAALFAELTSFVSKLTQLNSYGCNANLNFNANAGRIQVALHADFGYDLTNDNNPSMKAPKPSRVRRRQRRKQASQDSREESESFNISNDDNQTAALLDEPSEFNEPNKMSQAPTVSDQNCDGENLTETNSNTTAEVKSSLSGDEDEEQWTWTPPSEEDMLLYMKEHGYILGSCQEHSSQTQFNRPSILHGSSSNLRLDTDSASSVQFSAMR